jgi:hypothetical protein
MRDAPLSAPQDDSAASGSNALQRINPAAQHLESIPI